MSANTLAAAVAAARKENMTAVVPTQSLRVAAGQAPVRLPAQPASPQPAADKSGALSTADALMVAIQRSARTVDDIMTRRMLLASGNWGIAR